MPVKGEIMVDDTNNKVQDYNGTVMTTVVDAENQKEQESIRSEVAQEEVMQNAELELETNQKIRESKKKGRPNQKVTYMNQDDGLPQDTKLIGQEYIREELRKPLSVLFYFFLPIIMLLPVLNIVLIFTWTFGKYVNVNLRRVGIASMLWLILLIVAAIFFGETIFVLFSDWYESIIG